MEKFYKISESELVELLATKWSLDHMYIAGVDNWEDGGMVYEYFAEDCKAAGLPEINESYVDYTYKDLARTELKNYQEVK